MPMTSLDAMPAKLISPWFVNEDPSSFLKTDAIIDSHQSLEISSFVQVDPRSFVHSDVNTLAPSMQNHGYSPSDLVALCLSGKPNSLMISILDEGLVCTYLHKRRSYVADGQLNCSPKCFAQGAS